MLAGDLRTSPRSNPAMPMPASIRLSKYRFRWTIETPFKVGAYHSHGLPGAGLGADRRMLCVPQFRRFRRISSTDLLRQPAGRAPARTEGQRRACKCVSRTEPRNGSRNLRSSGDCTALTLESRKGQLSNATTAVEENSKDAQIGSNAPQSAWRLSGTPDSGVAHRAQLAFLEACLLRWWPAC